MRRLISKRTGRGQQYSRPRLRISRILAWADAHHARTGEWPKVLSGPVIDAPEESWRRINYSLVLGLRGLPGRSSLAKLSAEHRGVRNPQGLAPLSIEQILSWADAHHARTGRWPNLTSGPVVDAPEESWMGISEFLDRGSRGLPGGSSLAKLLAEHRGLRNVKALPPLSIEQILSWADAHHARTGQWPCQTSGDVAEAPGENWRNIQNSLVRGQRGLPASTTIAEVLREHRGVRNPQNLPRLTRTQILGWADAHRRRTGQWPTRSTGDIVDAPGEKWANVDQDLAEGLRGLHGGESLAQLLARCRGHRNIMELPRLTLKLILEWADAHFERTGEWPSQYSGVVIDAKGEKWKNIHTSLVQGQRGLPGSDTLARVLNRYRRVKRNRAQRTGRTAP